MSVVSTNYATMTVGRFTSIDVERLKKILQLDPDLTTVAEVVRRARESLTYPAESHMSAVQFRSTLVLE